MATRIATIWTIPIYTYGTCIAAGIIAAVYCLHRDRHATQYISPRHIDTITLLLIGASLIGGKMLGTLPVLVSSDQHIWDAVIYSGLSISGSVIVGVCASLAYMYYYNLDIRITADACALYAPIVHAFGRLGCFMSGCCHGNTTDSLLSVIYTDPESWAPCGIPMHPVQVYAMLWYIVAGGALWYLATRRHVTPGVITGLYLSIFAIARGSLDILRADHTPYMYGLSITQIISCIVIIVSMTVLLLTRYHDA